MASGERGGSPRHESSKGVAALASGSKRTLGEKERVRERERGGGREGGLVVVENQ
jgi:hypothetical protein